MKSLIIAACLFTVNFAHADSAFIVRGSLTTQRVQNATWRSVTSLKGSTYVLNKASAATTPDCKKGDFKLVSDNAITPRFYMLLESRCYQQ